MDSEQKLEQVVRRLNALRAKVADKGFKNRKETIAERRLVRAYRRLVESGN